MGDPLVIALILVAAAGAALTARLAFALGGRRGPALLVGGFVLLSVVNLSLDAFTDPARVASGAAIGFALGTLVGVLRYGAPGRAARSDRDDGAP